MKDVFVGGRATESSEFEQFKADAMAPLIIRWCLNLIGAYFTRLLKSKTGYQKAEKYFTLKSMSIDEMKE